MAKTNNLKDFLVDLYEGISSKKPNASRNPQDFRSEIESISGGGATIKSGGGTPVPNSGYVENVYLNTNLSVEEVVSILKQMNIENGYLVFLGQNEEGAVIGYNMAGLNEYIISDSNNNVYFSDVDGGWGFIGWNTNITNPIAVNSEVLSEIGSTTIGTQNDKLSNIFSTTPFTNETIELSGEYDGSTIEVTDLSGGWQGTVVPNTGYVENVYFNTELSVEEVVSLLEKLNYNADLMSSSGIDTYGLIGNPNVNILMVATLNGNYAIMANSNVLFSSAIVEGMTTFVGWNENFNGVFEYNGEALPTINNAMGEENDKLTSLFSTTPFTKSEENTINIKKYINEKKIPLSIKVNVDGAGGIEEVSEFPTENVKDEVIYKKSVKTKSNVCMYVFGDLMFQDENNVFEVENLPNDMLVCDLENEIMYIYLVEGVPYIKVDLGNGATIMTLGDLYKDFGIEFKGVIESVEDITEEGIYTILGKELSLLGVKNDTYNYVNNEWANYMEQCYGLLNGTVKSVHLPNLTNTRPYAFESCEYLETIHLPKVAILKASTFQNCESLKTAIFDVVYLIDTKCFTNCHSLTDIYLGSNVRVALGSTNVFEWLTQCVNIHVRAELIEEYTTGTNWSALIQNGQIVIVGDYSD